MFRANRCTSCGGASSGRRRYDTRIAKGGTARAYPSPGSRPRPSPALDLSGGGGAVLGAAASLVCDIVDEVAGAHAALDIESRL